MPRDMTPDERERFEREQLHHEPETKPDAGPASEAEVLDPAEPPRRPSTIAPPPNPD